MGSSREERQAGARPKRIPVRIATETVRESTRRSGVKFSDTGTRFPSVMRSTSKRLPQKAKARPNRAPVRDSVRLSLKTWRTRDQSRADGDAYTHFMVARCCAGEHQVGEVYAGH